MADFPFDIPKSLVSYCEQFEDDPEGSILKLRKHLKKRGLDPIGYLLLSWFYYLQDKREKAVQNALKAKIYAPGSLYISLMHYYFSHPQSMEAWKPDKFIDKSEEKIYTEDNVNFQLDLNQLIQTLSRVEVNRKIPRPGSIQNDEDLSKDAEAVDDIVSETLAKIHEQQGNLKQAIKIYQKLKIRNADGNAHYEKQIRRLQKKLKSN